MAQEHGDEDAAAEHGGPTWREYAFKWINFVLLAFLLYWVLVVAPPFVRQNFEFDDTNIFSSNRFPGLDRIEAALKWVQDKAGRA